MSNTLTLSDSLIAHSEAIGMLKAVIEGLLLSEYPVAPELAAKVLIDHIQKNNWPIKSMHDLKEQLKIKYKL